VSPLRIFHKVSQIPIRGAWKIFTRPDMVPAYLAAPPSVEPVRAAVTLLPECTEGTARQLREELLGNHDFFTELDRAMFGVRKRRNGWESWYEFVYILVRVLKPEIMIETGVFDGLSSSVTLEALRRNQAGRLVSIDLPARETITGSTEFMPNTSLPPGLQPGWLIPERLRSRHQLELGDAKQLLPRVLKEYPTIDIFMHDSLHTGEHMMLEYTLAWPHLREGGLLLSDDYMSSSAFHRFCRAHRRDYLQVANFAATRK
jgi:predicted O-methyltransferase YrrM